MLLVIKFIIKLLMSLVAVAFVTLLERKVVGSIQLRKGPVKVGVWGVFQPFSDAVKLFSKFLFKPSFIEVFFFFFSPGLGLWLALMMWYSFAYFYGGSEISFGFMFMLCILGGGVYPLLFKGWSSKSKFSFMGGVRSLAQMVSYEIVLAFLFLSPLMVLGNFFLKEFSCLQVYLSMLGSMLLVAGVMLVAILAELGRTPFDFSEGESELVSGFNVEYGSFFFAFIFMAEYSNIIFFSFLLSLMFFIVLGSLEILFIFIPALAFSVIWVRSSFPRFRYDLFMELTWKVFLYLSLAMILFYLVMKVLVFS